MESISVMMDVVVPVIYSVVGILITVAFAWLFKKQKGTEAYDQALEYLRAGVDQTYQVYVRAIKEASLDGKLTETERSKARAKAYLVAKEMALNEGKTAAFELLKSWTWDHAQSLIERLVNKAKDTGTTSPVLEIVNEVSEEPDNETTDPVPSGPASFD